MKFTNNYSSKLNSLTIKIYTIFRFFTLLYEKLFFILATPYLSYVDMNGNNCEMKKTTICWLLNQKERLTSDRLGRYAFNHQPKPSSNVTASCNENQQAIFHRDEICQGDFVIMNYNDNIGEVLSFQHLHEVTLKRKRFLQKVCSISTKDIGVLASKWYLVLENYSLKVTDYDYLEIGNYPGHTSREQVNFESLLISDNFLENLNKFGEILECSG